MSTIQADVSELLEPFDSDVIEAVAEKPVARDAISPSRLTDLLVAHQQTILGDVTEPRYIDLRHNVQPHSLCENETTCYFVVPPNVWSLERRHTTFSDNELATLMAVHTRQTRRRAAVEGRDDTSAMLDDSQGFVIHKPPFMKRAYRLQQETLLSDREAEVQALVEDGHSTETIAEILDVSRGAVEAMRYGRIPDKRQRARTTVELLDGD